MNLSRRSPDFFIGTKTESVSKKKPPRRLSGAICAVIILFVCGCQPQQEKRSVNPGLAGGANNTDVYQAYRPVRVAFLPLTEIKAAEQAHLDETITAFVALVDSDGSAVKWPGVFRFELYEYLPQSTERKGKRLHIWEDVDLRGFKENSEYWRDYLRAYEFSLEREATGHTKYILELTCITPDGKRLMRQFELAKK